MIDEIALLHLYCFVLGEILFGLAVVGSGLDSQPCERLRGAVTLEMLFAQ